MTDIAALATTGLAGVLGLVSFGYILFGLGVILVNLAGALQDARGLIRRY